MKNLLVFIFVGWAVVLSAQQPVYKIVDAVTGAPLPYATITFHNQQQMLYSDSTGNFILRLHAFSQSDSITIQYLGYKKMVVAVPEIPANRVFKMEPQPTELTEIIVSNCIRIKEHFFNKRVGKINNYIGPGPETKIIILSRYLNSGLKKGTIKAVELYGDYNERVHVPIRLRWYEWDEAAKKPGKELTNANLFVYPYKKGWNTFTLPENRIYFPLTGIVFGLEFIYPVEFEEQYASLKTIDQKAEWLQDMNNRWSLGMQLVKDPTLSAFYMVNNGPVQKYGERGKNLFIRPAIRFTVAACE